MSDAQHSSARPWPVVLLTALGAWLSAVPFMAVVTYLVGNPQNGTTGLYFVGVMASGAALMVLRSPTAPIFLEQLAIPSLMVGLGALGVAIDHDLRGLDGRLLMLVLATTLAWALPKDWLRVLLGALAAGLLVWLLSGLDCGGRCGNWHMLAYWQLHAVLLVWLGLLGIQRLTLAAWLTPFGAGCLLAALVGLVWVTGSSFLVAGHTSFGTDTNWSDSPARQGVSALLMVCTAAVALWAWPFLRTRAALVQAAVLTVVLTGLAWFMPTLGAACLALVVCATQRHWRLVGACAAAAVWVVGAFYYQLHWPLADKALLLIAAGSVLGALAWLSHRRAVTPALLPPDTRVQPNKAWQVIVAGMLITLVVVNVSIWQKQQLIANGQRVYMELMPQDPRSLMQGDFMRLRFAALQAADPMTSPLDSLSAQRPRMVVTLDPRGVAKPERMYGAGAPLGPQEMLLQLTRKDGQWVVVTDAWFFEEGQAKRWEAARYGEFRVLPDGQALLVDLADAQLRAIRSP